VDPVVGNSIIRALWHGELVLSEKRRSQQSMLNTGRQSIRRLPVRVHPQRNRRVFVPELAAYVRDGGTLLQEEAGEGVPHLGADGSGIAGSPFKRRRLQSPRTSDPLLGSLQRMTRPNSITLGAETG
jgi:hypothetical protein